MKKITLITTFLFSFVFSFQARVFAAELTEEERQIILDQLRDLGEDVSEICNCDANPGNLDTVDLDEVLRIWDPLISSNEGIFRGLVDSLGELARINQVFTRENDPYFLGYVMSMLKVFAQISAESGEKINDEDLAIVLNILQENYGVEIPPVALRVITNIKELSVVSQNGIHQMTIKTKNQRPIELDLTDPSLLGAQDGATNRLESLRIDNNARIVFADENAQLRNCVIGGRTYPSCDSRMAAMEFLSPLSSMTVENQTLTTENAQAAMNYAFEERFQRDEVRMNPLYMQFSGINVRGKAESFLPWNVSTNIEFKEAIILPGMDGGHGSFYLGGEVTAPFTRGEIQAAL